MGFMDQWLGAWNFGHGTARQNDPDFMRAARNAQRILDQGDVSQPYGALVYANAEALQFSSEAVPAAQNAIAGVISIAYDLVYQRESRRLGYEMDRQAFFNAYPALRQGVLNTPLPQNPVFFQQKIGSHTVGEYYPELTKARTVGDLQNWLVSTVDQGLRTASADLSAKGQNFEDVYQSMRLGVMEAIPTYQPTNAAGKTNQFLVHAGWGAFKGAKDYMRWEKGYSQASGSSLDILDEGVADSAVSGIGEWSPQWGAYQPRNDWAARQVDLFRQGQGVSGTMDYSYPALNVWTKPGYAGRTTYAEDGRILVAPLSNKRGGEFTEQATITEADITNLGAMYDQGLGESAEYRSLQMAVAGARRYITGALPSLGKEMAGFGAVEDFDNWVVARERRFSDSKVAGAYELIDPESQFEKENAVREGPDPANPQSLFLGSDPELAEYYGNTPVRDNGAVERDPLAGGADLTSAAAAGAETLNSVQGTAGRKRGDPALERAVRRNQFLRADPAMRSRPSRGGGTDAVEEASQNAGGRRLDAAYERGVEVGYEGDISSRYMEQVGENPKNTRITDVMTEDEQKLGKAVFGADMAAKKQVERQTAQAARAQSQTPAPARPTGPSHIAAHGYNGPIYGGIGGGMGNGPGVEPGMGAWISEPDDGRRLQSHNITGGGPSDAGNPPVGGNNPTPARNNPPQGGNNGAGDHRAARRNTNSEDWEDPEVQIPNEAPPLPSDDWMTGGNPPAGGIGTAAAAPDDDGRPRRRRGGRDYLPKRRDIGTGYQRRAMQIMGSSENYDAWRESQPDNQEARNAYDLFTRNTFIQAAVLPQDERQAFLDQHLGFIPEDQRATVLRLASQSARPAPRQSAVAIGSREREELGLRLARDIQQDAQLEYVRGNRARGLRGYDDDLYGQPMYRSRTDPHTGEVLGQEWQIYSRSGTVSATQTDIDAARGYAAEAIAKAPLGALPDNAQDIGATIDNRVKSLIRKRVDEYAKQLESQGVDPATAKAMAEARESIANHIVNSAKQEVISGLGGESQGNTSYHSTSVRSAEDIRRLTASNPEFKQKVEDTGLTPEQLAALPQGQSISLTADVDGTPSIFELGGGSGGGFGFNRQRGGLWGGKIGSALYGAYLMKRLWSMSAAPGIQESEQYLTGVGAEYDRWLGMSGQGSGISTRMALMAETKGRAASEIYGGFAEGSYLAGQVSPGLNRMGEYLGLSGGLAGGAFMGIGVLSQMGMLPEGLGLTAASAGPVAAVVGGAALTAGAGMELENQLFFGGRAVMTPGNMWHAGGLLLTMGKTFARGGWDILSGKKSFDQQFPGGLSGTGINSFLENNLSVGELSSLYAFGQKVAPDAAMERVRDLNEALAVSGMEKPEETAAVSMRLDKIFGSKFDPDLARRFGASSLALGLTDKENLSAAEQYASQMGYSFGSAGFQRAVQSYALSGDNARQEMLSWQGSRVAALGSQINSVLPWMDSYKGAGEEAVRTLGLTPTQTGTTASYIRGMQQLEGEPTRDQVMNLGMYAQRTNGYVGGVISDTASQFSLIGGSYTGMVDALSGIGMSNLQASHLNSYLSGDMGFASFQSWQSGDQRFRFEDLSGQSLFQTNGGELLKTLDYWSKNLWGSGMNPASAGYLAGQFNGFPSGGSARAQSSWLFGVKGTPTEFQSSFLSAWENGGQQGIEAMMRSRSAERQRDQAGIQLAQIALTEDYYWGAGSDGAWNAPAVGSSWYIQDQLRDLQDRSTRADFAAQAQRSQINNKFGIQREGNQLERMNTTNAYNLWQMDFSYQQGLRQRQWTREDWQYQDTTRELNFGWSLEDINENIRYASGRQRRDLIRQRDRMTVSHNLDEQQVDKTRERQEETWAREDERYEKTKTYTLDLQRLDKESYDLNIEQRKTFYRMDREEQSRKLKEYEEQKKWEDELQELTRKYQYEQLQLQKASAAAAAEAAEEQRQYNDMMAQGSEAFGRIAGAVSELEKYDTAFRVINALGQFASELVNVKFDVASQLTEVMKTIAALDSQKLQALQDVLEDLNQP